MSVMLQASVPLAAGLATSRGEALFEGGAPLRGRIDGHFSGLPADVLVCAHCHIATRGDDRPGDPPDLRGGWLHRPMQRRNGPPGVYDAAKLCTALRSGIDPVQIRIPTRMPRFDIPDEDCVALWNYLESSASVRP